MFCLLVIPAFTLDPLLANLSKRARARSKLPRASFTDKPIWASGKYDFDGVKFGLPQPLITSLSPSVSGHAASRYVLAAISDDLPQGVIFVDDDTQDLLQIGKRIGSDGEVDFYNVTQQSFLTVFTHLRLHVAQQQQENSCKDQFGLKFERRCYFGIRSRWNDTTQFPVGEVALQGFEKFCGGKVNIVGTANLEFKCWEVILSWMFTFEAVCGGGFKVNQTVSFTMPKYDTECYTVKAASFGIWKLNFTLALQGCVGTELKEAVINLPRSFAYSRIWGITLKHDGVLSTTEGYIGSPSRFKYVSERKNNFDLTDIFDAVDSIQIMCDFEADVALQVFLGVPQVEYYFRVGLILTLKWAFVSDKTKCVCPYLYGAVTTNIYFYWRTSELKVLGFKLLEALSKRHPLAENLARPRQCLFDPDEAKEGLSWLQLEDDPPSWVVSNITFGINGVDMSAFKFKSKLEVLVQDGSVYQDLQFPDHSWNSCLVSCDQSWTPPGKLVTILPKGATMRWSAAQAMSLFVPPKKDQVDFAPRVGEATWKSLGAVGTVKYLCEKARNVALNVEFEGKNTRYVSVKPSVDVGESIGVVVHTVVGGEKAYTAVGLEKAIDSSRLDDANTEYRAHDYVDIEISSFVSHYGSVATIEFLRDDTFLKYGRNDELTVHGPVDGSAFNLGNIEFDLSDDPRLRIQLRLATGKEDRTGQNVTWEIGSAELRSAPSFVVRRSSPEAEIALSVRRSQPNVVFQFGKSITENELGIVCRVFKVQPDGTPANLVMPENEVYGILKIEGGATQSGVFNRIVIAVPGLVALGPFTELDDGVWLVAVEDGKTVVGKDIQVPFRRLTPQAFVGTAKVVVMTFATVRDHYCGDGISVPVREQDVSMRVGCIEEITPGMEILDGWTAVGDLQTKSGRAITLPREVFMPKVESQTVSETRWRYHGFDVYASGKVDIFPTYYQFPENTASITLTSDLIDPLARHHVDLRISCPRADRIDWVRGGNSSNAAQPAGIPPVPNTPGLFAFVPPKGDVADDLVIWARCLDMERSFCLFNVDFRGLWLLRYQSPGGLVDPRYTGKGEEDWLLRGVTRQLVTGRKNALVYKTWNGPIERLKIKEQDTLTLTYARWGNWATLSLALGNVSVPFSMAKCTGDPNGFFAAVGFAGSPDGLMADAVNFTVDGNIQINPKYFDPSVVKNGFDFRKVTTILPEYVKGVQKFVDTFSSPTPKVSRPRASIAATLKAKGGVSKNIIMVASIAGAGVAVVIIVAIIIFVVLRKRSESPSHSEDAQDTQDELLNQ